MCYIITAIKIKPDKQAENSILRTMENQQDEQPNGTGSVCFNIKKTDFKIDRKMKESRQAMKNKLKSHDFVSYHFRTATSGLKDKRNVHFWKKGNWTFCHNGTISNQADDENSDSNNFFNNIYELDCLYKNGRLNYEKIAEYTSQFNFCGRFLLINEKYKKIYFFGDFNFYVLNKSYLVITSTSTDFTETFKTFGIEFETEQKLEILEKEIEGIYMINLKTGTFKQLDETFDNYTYKNTRYPTTTENTDSIETEKTTGNLEKYYPLLFNGNKPKTTDELAKQIETELALGYCDADRLSLTEIQQLEYDQVLKYQENTTKTINEWKQIKTEPKLEPLI